MPERYTRGLRYLDSLLLFFILSSPRRRGAGVCPTDGGVCPMNLETPLYALLSRPYSRTLLVFCPVHPQVDLFSTETWGSRKIVSMEARKQRTLIQIHAILLNILRRKREF